MRPAHRHHIVVRQISFTLLMACRCDSHTAQYERNRSFGHLVDALGRAAGGAKVPSAGLCRNGSKAEASLADDNFMLSFGPDSIYF